MEERESSLEYQASKRLGSLLGGKYRLDRLLGVGGMGAVYAATHRNGHRVAVKVLHARLSTDDHIRRLFRREARVANRVGHPGVVTVLDDDETSDGTPYLVMELLVGETLRERWLRAGRRLPVEEVLVFAYDVLDVLAAAHEKGVIHRDIKPDNLFLTTKGDLRVLDFGVARLVEPESGSNTRSGLAIGTPEYMAPEQVLGRTDEIGPEADVWAVGAMMFLLLSGKPVHEAMTTGETLVRAATRPARSLNDVLPDAPAQIVAIVDRALAFERNARWRSARAMAQAVEASHHEMMHVPLAMVARPSADAGVPEELLQLPDVHDAQTELPREKSAVGTALARTHSIVTRRRRGRTAAILAVTSCIVVSAISIAVYRTRSAAPRATPRIHPSSAATPQSVRAEAFLLSAKRMIKDGSWDAARTNFESAIAEDSLLAAAHLRLAAMANSLDQASRLHYRRSVDLRAMLSPADQGFLDALAPSFESPPNLAGTARALAAIARARPADAELAFFASLSQFFAGNYDEALTFADLALQRDGAFFGAQIVKGRVLVRGERYDDARAAYAACLRGAPSATDCLDDLNDIDAMLGRCTDAESWSRQLIGIEPTNYRWYADLGRALDGRGAGIDTVRATYALALQRAPDDVREQLRHQYGFGLALLGGHFDDAITELDAWEAATASEPDEEDHVRRGRLRVELLQELGQKERARAAAFGLQQRRSAWISNSRVDYGIIVTQELAAVGGTSSSDLLQHREDWLRRESGRLDPWSSWAIAWTAPIRSFGEASASLERAPAPGYLRDVDFQALAGHTFLLGRRFAEAEKYLSLAAHSCRAVFYPLEHTRANLDLGLLLESQGKDALACEAFAVVLRRWRTDPRSVTGRMAAEASRRNRCEVR